VEKDRGRHGTTHPALRLGGEPCVLDRRSAPTLGRDAWASRFHGLADPTRAAVLTVSNRIRSTPRRPKRLLGRGRLFPAGFDAGDLYYPWPPYFRWARRSPWYSAENAHPNQHSATMRARGHDDRMAREEAEERDRLASRAPAQRGPPGSKPMSARTASTRPAWSPRSRTCSRRQARETDAKKREALIHQIQGILHDR